MVKAVCNDAQRQGLHAGNRLIAGRAVTEHASQVGHLGEPPAVIFTLKLDRKGHASTVPSCKLANNRLEPTRNVLVGVISDTHGLLRPEAVAALQGSDVIIHAGDVGTFDVIERLNQIAPTFAVRGNNDTEDWASSIPLTQIVEVGELLFYVLHELPHLAHDPSAAGHAAVVSGHSHRPSIEVRAGVLYLNPGSAGPRRFRLPVTVARVDVLRRTLRPSIVELEIHARR